jgi:Right handed beta helix region
VTAATAATVVCLPAGAYGHLTLSGTHAGNVTVEPVPGAGASIAGVSVAEGAANITIHNFSIGGGVSIGAGASHITVDHNDIDGELPGGDGEGVETVSVNCSAPNAPVYEGCVSEPPCTYITISANRIHGFGQGTTEDAIHLNNWQHVRVIANDLYALEEHGNHTDALQSVWGGSDLVFERNYEHDNQSQGFFISDGDVSEVKVADNLFLRNNNLGLEENNIQIFNTAPFTMTNNTVWDHQGDLLRAEASSLPLSATVERNVEEVFNVFAEGGPEYKLTEDYDIFHDPPWTFEPGPHTTIVEAPEFVDPATDDYRLKANPNDIGVNWAPAEYVYGPTGN